MSNTNKPVYIVQADFYDTAMALIEVAVCPQCDGSKAYYDNQGEVRQCQWCYERGLVVEAYNKKDT